MAFRDMVNNVRDLVEAPLTEPLNAVHLSLIVGIIIIAWGGWMLLFSTMREALGE